MSSKKLQLNAIPILLVKKRLCPNVPPSLHTFLCARYHSDIRDCISPPPCCISPNERLLVCQPLKCAAKTINPHVHMVFPLLCTTLFIRNPLLMDKARGPNKRPFSL